MKLPKPLIVYLLVPICLFTLAQCGLEYLPYLTPPESLTSGSFFRVRKTEANDSESSLPEWEYQGIELYYKLYLPSASLETNYTKLSELQDNGFFRLYSSNDQSGSFNKPLIDVNSLGAGDLIFRIDPAPANLNIMEEDSLTEMVGEIRRGVLYGSAETGYPAFRPFLWNDPKATNSSGEGFYPSHADVSEALYSFMTGPPGGEAIMLMYALSYGKTGGVLLDLHSDAVYLGQQSVNFGW